MLSRPHLLSLSPPPRFTKNCIITSSITMLYSHDAKSLLHHFLSLMVSFSSNFSIITSQKLTTNSPSSVYYYCRVRITRMATLRWCWEQTMEPQRQPSYRLHEIGLQLHGHQNSAYQNFAQELCPNSYITYCFSQARSHTYRFFGA